MKTEHWVAIIAGIGIFVTLFGTIRQSNKDLTERVAGLEAKLEAMHEVCCSEIGR